MAHTANDRHGDNWWLEDIAISTAALAAGGGGSAITSVIPGVGATNLGKAEDSVHTSGDVGVMELGVANEAQTVFGSDGDYTPHATDTKGNTIIVGNVAAGATDSGAPVKVGAKYNSTLPTLTNGQRGDLNLGSRGALAVELWQSGTSNSVTMKSNNIDGIGTDASTNSLAVSSVNRLFNGTTYDRQYGIANGTNSTGTGIQAVGLVGQFDDASQVTPTENQFVNARVGASHQLLTDRLSPYPYGATSITAASGNVANASAVATLPASATKTTYITGFTVSSSGATVGSVVSVTVVGTVSTTLTYTYAAPAGVLTMGTPLVVPFPVAIPGSAVNTAIVVTLPALGGGNTNATVVAHGYQL